MLVAVGLVLIAVGAVLAASAFIASRPEGPSAEVPTATTKPPRSATTSAAAADRPAALPGGPPSGPAATDGTTALAQIERTAFPEEMRRCLDRKAALTEFERTSPPPAVLTACADEVDRAASFVEGLTEVGIATPDQAQCLHDAILDLDDSQVAELMQAISSTADGAPPQPIRSLFDRCGVEGATQ